MSYGKRERLNVVVAQLHSWWSSRARSVQYNLHKNRFLILLMFPILVMADTEKMYWTYICWKWCRLRIYWRHRDVSWNWLPSRKLCRIATKVHSFHSVSRNKRRSKQWRIIFSLSYENVKYAITNPKCTYLLKNLLTRYCCSLRSEGALSFDFPAYYYSLWRVRTFFQYWPFNINIVTNSPKKLPVPIRGSLTM